MSFRVVGFWSAVGALIGGVVLANLVIHPQGTQVLTNAGLAAEKQSVNGLLGKTS